MQSRVTHNHFFNWFGAIISVILRWTTARHWPVIWGECQKHFTPTTNTQHLPLQFPIQRDHNVVNFSSVPHLAIIKSLSSNPPPLSESAHDINFQNAHGALGRRPSRALRAPLMRASVSGVEKILDYAFEEPDFAWEELQAPEMTFDLLESGKWLAKATSGWHWSETRGWSWESWQCGRRCPAVLHVVSSIVEGLGRPYNISVYM